MDDLLERVRELPCGRRLLEAAAGVDGAYLVGGAVRDLLLGRVPQELDVAVEGEVGALAAALGAPRRPRALRHGDRARRRLPLGPGGGARRETTPTRARCPTCARRRSRRTCAAAT